MGQCIPQTEGCALTNNNFQMTNITSSFVDRRNQRSERRINNRKAAVKALYRRRRHCSRRISDDIRNTYVDRHEPQTWIVSTSLMLLCVLDAFFTTILISHGSYELNPVLDYLLKSDQSLFLATKFVVTGLCISFLVLHKHYRLWNIISCYQLLVISLVIYTLLVCYELSMVRLLPVFI